MNSQKYEKLTKIKNRIFYKKKIKNCFGGGERISGVPGIPVIFLFGCASGGERRGSSSKNGVQRELSLRCTRSQCFTSKRLPKPCLLSIPLRFLLHHFRSQFNSETPFSSFSLHPIFFFILFWLISPSRRNPNPQSVQ